jgi:RNA polymerase sigma-70 factor (ECF subfamily)
MSKDSKRRPHLPTSEENISEVVESSEDRKPKIDWERALREHEQWLKTIIGARLGEPQAVDEVWQEVSMAAVRQKAPLQDPDKIAPWLYRIAVMQSLMYRRKMGRRRKMVDRYVEYYEPTETQHREADPLHRLLLEERRDEVRQAMQRLPKRDAEMLMLKYGHGWSYRGIADHVGTTVSAVQARLHRARQRLRGELTADTTITEES